MRLSRTPSDEMEQKQLKQAIDVVRWCREATRRGDSAVVTCMGGLGRRGTVVACCLVAAGLTADAAVASVRNARGPRALETTAQERFVGTFAAMT